MTPDATAAQQMSSVDVKASDPVYGASYFAATHRPVRERPQLRQDVDVDICIIGGGLAGLTVARETARRGWSVLLLEAKRLAWNASGRNTGFVTPGFTQDIEAIVARTGLQHARELWSLSQAGVDYVRQTAAGLPGIDATSGWLDVSKTDRKSELADKADLLRSFDADVEFWPANLVRSKLRSEFYFQAIHHPTAFNIHPLNYALGLAQLAEDAGARLCEQTRVISIDATGVRKRIATEHARIRAMHVVLAGNVHLDGLMPQIAETLLPVHTYVIVTKPLGAALREAIDYPGSVSDTAQADNHYRILEGDRLLWSGRMTVWEGSARRYGRKLRTDVRRRFPQLQDVEVDYAWTGQLGLTVHRMPQIGELSRGVWLASGFGSRGLATTAMAGDLIARGIAESDDRWRLFQPFELVWAGGRTGRIVMQAAYWAQRPLQALASRRSKRMEAWQAREEERRKKRAEREALRAHIRAEADAAWEAARRERVRIAAEKEEARRIERARIAAEKAEARRIRDEQRAIERAEAARIKAERREAQRVENARLAAERAEAKRIRDEQRAIERAEAERLKAERREAKRIEAERIAAEKAEARRLRAEQLAAEAQERARLQAEQIAAEAARHMAEQAEAERLEAARVEAERFAAEQAEAERLAAERFAAEQAEAERLVAREAAVAEVASDQHLAAGEVAEPVATTVEEPVAQESPRAAETSAVAGRPKKRGPRKQRRRRH